MLMLSERLRPQKSQDTFSYPHVLTDDEHNEDSDNRDGDDGNDGRMSGQAQGWSGWQTAPQQAQGRDVQDPGIP